MLDAVLSSDALFSSLEQLAAQRTLVAPLRVNGHYQYRTTREARRIDLQFSHADQSPKAFLFPPSETLLQFDRQSGRFESQPVVDNRPWALVGVHPCDLHAIQLLDAVFAEAPRDTHYAARRANAFIIGVDCSQPCAANCFCADMRTNSACAGFDIMLYPLQSEAGLNYGIACGSDAGRAWILHDTPANPPTDNDRAAFRRYAQQKLAAFPSRLNTPLDDLPRMMSRSHASLAWEAVARRCYSCGSCNLVCPTCYCFDIQDKLSLAPDRAERVRAWDGCQLREFAAVAGGHNFRPRAAQRLRHRVFRKAKWIREQSGHTGCVGCGRCSRACTAKISILEILNQLAEEVTNK